MGVDLERRRALAERLFEREVRHKPKPRQFARPVAWLLGPEMLGAVKQLVLHVLYKGEFDPHDWMTGEVVRYPEPAAGAPKELWFDYIADLGDGQAATYTNALVLQDDLYVEGTHEQLAVCGRGAAQLPALAEGPPAGWTTLPRGQFVVVGGDTAYPVADAINLDAHVRQPFTWAYRDLVAAGRLVDDTGAALHTTDLYGVPGNHDYYDLLAGFRRIFRAPTTDRSDGARSRRRSIELLGLRRRQSASYGALDLPWDWRVWLLDPGERDLDYRQECFFREHGVTRKMIVTMPTPPVVFGRVLAERSWLDTMASIGLAAPFLGPPDQPTILRDGKPADPALPRTLPDDHCRLDIAGDIHCYQRYGAAGEPMSADARPASYAAVVSGAGGAFSHSTATDFGEVPVRAVYPDPDAARRVFAARLFAPFSILGNGAISVITFALAALVCVCSFRSDTRVITDTLLGAIGVDSERAIGGGATSRAAAGWQHLTGAALMVGAFVLGVIMILFAIRYARWITHALRSPADERPWFLRAIHRIPGGSVLAERGFVPAWILAVGAIVLPTIISQFAWLPSAATLMFQIFFVSVLLVIAGGLLLLARVGGAEYQRPRERWVFWVFGAIHAAIQLALPLVIVRVGFARPLALAVALAIFVASAALGFALARAPSAWARWGSLAIWAAHPFVITAVLIAMTGGVAVAPSTTVHAVWFVIAAGLLGSLIGCYELGWYLAAASTCNGHNNEVGVASRVDSFNELIRFRVEPDRLTGYVIAIDTPATSLGEARARVVDVFTVAPRQPSSGVR